MSIYINSNLSDEDDESKIVEKAQSEELFDAEGQLDRAKLGNFIGCMGKTEYSIYLGSPLDLKVSSSSSQGQVTALENLL